MVEVFITNVQSSEKANSVMQDFEILFPHYIVNFDLEDCDKILRIESENINIEKIIRILNEKNIACKILE
ncbi:MAG: hypothetical protein JNJ41_02095 [Bacteroidia bacterium]|nr:hypothetical protein [Bacteroidia bacterium]